MDAEKRMIPLVEDDQGEGIKDFLDFAKTEIEGLYGVSPAKEFLKKRNDANESLRMILDVLNGLARKIDLIFSGHALINGQWVDVTKKISGENK